MSLPLISRGHCGENQPMRLLKVFATLAIVLTFILVAGFGRRGDRVWAQLPTPNPLVAPRPLPSAPAQLAAPVLPEGVPSLMPVAPVATPTPAPSLRVFNCSCFGGGVGTHWMGRVQAQSYFAARQGAVSACISYNEKIRPQSPFMPPRSTSSFASSLPPLPPGSEPLDLAGSQGEQLPGGVTITNQAQVQMCSKCTCD